MKSIGFALAIFAVVACSTAQLQAEESEDMQYYESPRFRREANPQGSVVIQGTKPLGGPDRRPSLDIDYQQNIHNRNGLSANAYGGLNIRPGQAAQPHIGINAEKTYRNGFLGGFGQVQRGPGGRPDPTFGIRGGFRFRRDVADLMDEEQGY